MCVQIESLEMELKEVTHRHEKLKAEMEEESQDPGVKLMASQLAEYKSLKNDAEKKSASLKQKLDRVSSFTLLYLHCHHVIDLAGYLALDILPANRLCCNDSNYMEELEGVTVFHYFLHVQYFRYHIMSLLPPVL